MFKNCDANILTLNMFISYNSLIISYLHFKYLLYLSDAKRVNTGNKPLSVVHGYKQKIVLYCLSYS
jgi:hypothetical protein